MRVMGERAYPVSETFVTSTGRRSRPPPMQPADTHLEPMKRESASRRMKELAACARESCLFREKALDVEALEAAMKERSESQVSPEKTPQAKDATQRAIGFY